MVKIFEGKEIRIVIKNGTEWFRVSDICEVLELTNLGDAVRATPKDDIDSIDVIDTIGRRQSVYFINEPGLYRLVFKSRKEGAEKFKNWVFSDVLPAIRKTGEYSIPKELKEKSTKARNLMTDTWKENGVEKPVEYAMLTIGEYKQLQIQAGKRKKDFNKKELLLLQALESLETLNLYYNPVKGFIECKSSLVSTASNIKMIVSKD